MWKRKKGIQDQAAMTQKTGINELSEDKLESVGGGTVGLGALVHSSGGSSRVMRFSSEQECKDYCESNGYTYEDFGWKAFDSNNQAINTYSSSNYDKNPLETTL